MEFDRLELLIKEKGLVNLQQKTVLVLGVGGVGGYSVESLVRSGIGTIILVDYDVVDVTNINRQIIALHSNINKKKVDCFKERIYDINPNCKVITYDLFYDENNKNVIFDNKIDFIIDCCDSLKSKEVLIKEAIKRKIKIISSMGTGNKFDPTRFIITSLDKTNYDPLARKLRNCFRNNKEALKIPVIYSKEESVKGLMKIGSTAYVPSVAGLMLTSYVINYFIKEDENNEKD